MFGFNANTYILFTCIFASWTMTHIFSYMHQPLVAMRVCVSLNLHEWLSNVNDGIGYCGHVTHIIIA
jgi:hypothetical protein